jgi:soluble lytic murein transglycosylase-like protein
MVTNKKSLTFLMLLAASIIAIATQACADETCWEAAAKQYDVSEEMLVAIAMTESNLDVNAFRENINTYDIGIMQINSSWLPELEKYGITESDLFEPCTNINIGAWIYAQEVARYGNSWIAVGAYHTGAFTEDTKQRKLPRIYAYAEKVHKNYLRYFGSE